MSHCAGCHGVPHVCARNVPIFAALDEEGLAEVNSLIQSLSYGKGELLFNQGDVGTHLYIVRSGRVKLYNVSAEGRQQILRILSHGDFFGELTLFQDTRQFCYAETMETSDICQLRQADFRALLGREPKVAMALLEAMSVRLSQAESFISDLTLKTVEERLISWLMMKAQTGVKMGQEVEITLDLNREELAHLLGTTIETVSRRLNGLQADGVLTLHGHRSLVINDMDGLEALLFS